MAAVFRGGKMYIPAMKWVETPKTCKDCKEWDPKAKKCKNQICKYKAKR